MVLFRNTALFLAQLLSLQICFSSPPWQQPNPDSFETQVYLSLLHFLMILMSSRWCCRLGETIKHIFSFSELQAQMLPLTWMEIYSDENQIKLGNLSYRCLGTFSATEVGQSEGHLWHFWKQILSTRFCQSVRGPLEPQQNHHPPQRTNDLWWFQLNMFLLNRPRHNLLPSHYSWRAQRAPQECRGPPAHCVASGLSCHLLLVCLREHLLPMIWSSSSTYHLAMSLQNL